MSNREIPRGHNGIFNCYGALWIGRRDIEETEIAPAPFLKKEFSINKAVKKSTLYVSGLGQYEGTINDVPIDENIVFAPTVSDYDKTVYYNIYSLENKLKEGKNEICFVLGRGRYAFNTAGTPWNGEKASWIDTVKLIAVIKTEYEDGSESVVVSDDSWLTKASPIVQDCMYMGETYDARLCESKDSWEKCVLKTAPKGQLAYDYSEPIVIKERIAPIACRKVCDKTYVFEFKDYITGWIELDIDCPQNCEVNIQYSEILQNNGEVILKHSITPNGRLQQDKFISNGKRTKYRPSFSYKGFRYVQVEGILDLDISKAVACRIHNDVKPISTLKCSNEYIQWVHDAFCRTLLSNLQGIPTDTPVFEKHGWTADAGVVVPSALYNYDLQRFYKKWLDDFYDSQNSVGKIPVIVPTTGWGFDETCDWKDICGPVPLWDICYPFLVYNLYWCYNDTDVLSIHYEPLKKYAIYLTEFSKDSGICTKGLGDWLAPTGNVFKDSAEPPEGAAITEGAYHIRIFQLMIKIAEVLQKKEDVQIFEAERNRLIKIYNDLYFDSSLGYYCTDTCKEFRQAPNVLAVVFGIADEKKRNRIMTSLLNDLEKRDYRLGTGIFSSHYLLIALSEYGYHDIACKVFLNEGYPGWNYIFQKGDTTLCESWEYECTRSHCHYATGAVEEWIIKYVVGIKQLAPGYQKVHIEPNLIQMAEHIDFAMETISGKIEIKCEYTNNKRCCSISVEDGIELI